ncbi:MAG: cell division protein FtsZ [Robiginitomaculum sp.]|nr:cell division protein FtsZ [Robiginitomaculum sp.]MDQ7077651.1 cell division protein FtsZ [Robiginitomaculum sp.]
MAISLTAPKVLELKPRIVVFGVGGAGGNAVNNMIEADLQGVEFVVANTDAQALHFSKAECTIQMGPGITGGLGAGADPEKGAQSAEDSIDEINAQIEGAHMVFITAGMGGGTGTGAAPVIARLARERGILTVGVVTKPFRFEGDRRMRIAEQGIEDLQGAVDTLIIIPNQNLFRITNDKTTVTDAFSMADEVLHSGVRGLTSLMVQPGLINLDFADVRTVMNEMGKALMGTGEAGGEDRAVEAARAAIANPLLDDVAIRGAQGVLINITGGADLTLHEVDEAAELIRGEVDEGANIIVGATFDDSLDGVMRVSVVATGIDMNQAQKAPRETVAAPMAAPRPNPVMAQAPVPPVAPEPPVLPTVEAPAEAAPLAEEVLEYPPLDCGHEEAVMQSAPVKEEEPFVAERAPEELAEEQPRQSRFGLGFLGLRRKPSGPPPAFIADELPKMNHHSEPRREAPVREEEAPTADLFGGHIDEELEIPAFLRRQAN